jgi:hypothetical protein
VLSHLNQTVASAAHTPKLTVLAGSYDTFLAFFGLANLTAVSGDFYGLPDYASTMAFELFSAGDDEDLDTAALHVRYLFRNGTAGALEQFPLFGSGKADLPWAEFVTAMQTVGVSTTEEWCGLCESKAVFCAAYGGDEGVSVKSGNGEETVSKGSWIAVLVVMAVAIVGNLVWAAMWLLKSRRANREKTMAAAAAAAAPRGSESVRSYDKESV